MKGKFENLTGREFERLTVLGYLGNGRWFCDCSCGKKAIVRTGHLKSEHTRSCGCLGLESSKVSKNVKHGFWNINFSEGTMKFYLVWRNLKARCNNPKLKCYKNYGGRGITYDSRWEKFLEFKKDMWYRYTKSFLCDKMKSPSIERRDVNGNYCKDNCTFIELSDQRKNTRVTYSFIAISPDGKRIETKNVNEFAKEHGLSSTCIYRYLNKDLKKSKTYKGWKFSVID